MRILLAPTATEGAPDTQDTPNSITNNWVKDTIALYSPKPEAEAQPKKEPDGQTDTGRPVSEPPPKPVVVDPTPVAPVKPEPANTPEVKSEPAKTAPEEWETATAPKGIPVKDFEAWKKGRKESETKLKAEIKSREDKLAEVEAKLSEISSKTEPTGELPPDIKSKIESQEYEIKELRSALMEADVTKDVRWKAHFDGGKEKIIARAKAVVGQERAAEVEAILKLKDEDYRTQRLAQFLEETESPFVATQLNIQVDKLNSLNDEYATEFKKIQDHNETLASERKSNEERAQLERVQSFDRISKALADPENGFLPYQKQADNPAWNEGVDQRVALVKSILTGKGKDAQGNDIKPETILRGAFDAAAMPVVLQSYKNAMEGWAKEKAELESKIQAFSAAQPGPGGNVNEKGDPDKLTITPDMDPHAINKAFARKAAQMAKGL